MFDGVDSRCVTLPLTDALSDLLEELSQLDTESHVANPVMVMRALEPYAKQFDFSLQQDAAEALDYLTNALQEERLAFFGSFKAFRESISEASTNLTNVMVIEDGGAKKNSPLKNWKRWPLEGMIGSLLMCQECGFQFSTQFDTFHELLLSPPQLSNGNIVARCSLEACLEQFTAPECVTDVRCSYCSHSLAIDLLREKNELNEVLFQKIKDCTFDDDCSCEQLVTQMGGPWKNVYVKAAKQLRIGCSPEVICCQLQRVVVSSSGELVKWMGHVSFPPTLDLHPYMMSSQEHVGKLSSQQLKGRYASVSKYFQPKRMSEAQQNFHFSYSKVPVSTDGSSSDDTHLSGSDDLASDTSSESVMGRFGDELGDKHKEAGDTIQWDTCQMNGSRDAKMYGLDNLLSSKLSKSHVILDDKDQLLLRFRELDGLTFVESHPQAMFMHHLFPENSAPSFLMANALSQKKNREVHVAQDGASCISQRRLYELISVVVHHGSSKGGHYTVYRRAKCKKSDFIQRDHPNADDLASFVECNTDVMDLDSNVSRGYPAGSTVASESDETKSTEDRLYGSGNEALSMDEESLECHFNAKNTFSVPQSLGSYKELNVKDDAYIDSMDKEEREQPSNEEIVLWFRVSDSHVTLVTQEEVLMAQATLLFYERIEAS
ncbi:hypothetical protein KP509_22G008100 [Ceratopteris richardii]|nr:hypothetical protein KP509_22G008100 [Ceratopteris richardii]